MALAAVSPAAAAPLRCGGIPYSGEGDRVTDLRATHTTCHHARTLVHAWRQSQECYGTGIGGLQSCVVLRYSCDERKTRHTYTTMVVCTRSGGRRVTWRNHVD